MTEIGFVKFGRFKERFIAGENIFEFFVTVVDGGFHVFFQKICIDFQFNVMADIGIVKLSRFFAGLSTAYTASFLFVAIAQIFWYLDEFVDLFKKFVDLAICDKWS